MTETVPAGYAVTSANPQTATVVEDTTCADRHAGDVHQRAVDGHHRLGRLADPGGTASTIDCDAVADPPFDATTDPVTGDGSFSLTNQVPGTYVCTIVVDP